MRGYTLPPLHVPESYFVYRDSPLVIHRILLSRIIYPLTFDLSIDGGFGNTYKWKNVEHKQNI